jgi:hypothetical protein
LSLFDCFPYFDKKESIVQRWLALENIGRKKGSSQDENNSFWILVVGRVLSLVGQASRASRLRTIGIFIVRIIFDGEHSKRNYITITRYIRHYIQKST